MKKLLFVLTTAVLLILTACNGSFVDPGMGAGREAAAGLFGDDDSGHGGGNKTNSSVPTGLTAAAQSSSSIRISWNSVSGAVSYIVYRSSSVSGKYDLVGFAVSTSYTDMGLSSGTTYYYKVSAVDNSNKESAMSSSVSAKTY